MFLDAKHRRAILARHKNALLLAAMILLVVFSWAIVWLWAQYSNTATELTKLATENEQMRFADERMTRSKTDFQRPGVTAEEVQWIKAISDDYGIPADILYAMRRTENGGRGLYVGANHIDQEIRRRYPPLWWRNCSGRQDLEASGSTAWPSTTPTCGTGPCGPSPSGGRRSQTSGPRRCPTTWMPAAAPTAWR